jgi:hypothetical protein
MKENGTSGRILKIKTGYNPNSSGIGVDIMVFFTAGAAASVLFNVVAAIVSSLKAREDGHRAELSGQERKEQEVVS